MTTRHAHRRSSPQPAQRGLATVEFALVLLPLVLLLAATADLGRAFYTFDSLTKAARSAARYLALANPPDADQREKALSLVLYGNTQGSGTKLVGDLSSSHVVICTPTLEDCKATHDNQPPAGGTVDLVSVTISGYAYTSLFSALLPAKLNFRDISVTMRAYQ